LLCGRKVQVATLKQLTLNRRLKPGSGLQVYGSSDGQSQAAADAIAGAVRGYAVGTYRAYRHVRVFFKTE
jgi:hypothetical protein